MTNSLTAKLAYILSQHGLNYATQLDNTTNKGLTMKSLKAVLVLLSIVATTHMAHAAECVNSTEELAKNSSRTLPDFLRNLPANFASSDGKVRFSMTAPARKYYDKNGNQTGQNHLFRGRWDASGFGGGDLYAKTICVQGSSFTMLLEDGSKFSAELSGNNFIFKKLLKTFVLSPR